MEEYIAAAAAHFEELLRQQLRRQEAMEQGAEARDFAAAEKIRIGVVGGDGIGPIIMAQARRVLEKLLADELASGRVELREIEGLTLENRMEKGEAVPADVLAAIKDCDVLLKGPTTTPKGGTLESANVTLRRELDLYANVRPVSVPEEGIDWIFFRENTEGEYALGSRGIELPGKLTMDFKVTTDAGTRRIARAAFDYARLNGKKNVAIVTKANIMKKTDGMFSRIAHEVAAEYPEIDCDDWYIDIMTANLVNPAVRAKFQVFLLPNLYGDIITDEAAQIQGGVGTAGSGASSRPPRCCCGTSPCRTRPTGWARPCACARRSSAASSSPATGTARPRRNSRTTCWKSCEPDSKIPGQTTVCPGIFETVKKQYKI